MPTYHVARGPLNAGSRKQRRPGHRFHLKTRPWQIQPFMIAPVLPGESLTNLLLQSRVVTDPIKNPLIGWWKEYFFFYVKHRDMPGRDDFAAMALDPTFDMSAYQAGAASLPFYTFDGGIEWVEQALEQIVLEYFRNENEPYMGGEYTLDSLPAASVNDFSWMHSVLNDADNPDMEQLIPVDAATTPDTVKASDVETALIHYQYLRANGLTEQTYEEWLRSFGVSIPDEDDHKPELIRYVREWTYPSNTVNPSTGAPTSACSWAVAERADKRRFFKEPGFIVGVTCTRPKVYFANQEGAAVGLLSNSLAWLPAVGPGQEYIRRIKVTNGEGPLPANTDSYWVDLTDLFLYGDQYSNIAIDSTIGGIALPTAGLVKRFAALTDAQGLFVDGGGGGTAQHIKEDGIVSLSIASRFGPDATALTSGDP